MNKIPTFEEFLNEAKKFVNPSDENADITKLVTAILDDTDYDLTFKDVAKKTKKYQDIRTQIEKEVDKKELKRIELKYNSFDRYLTDLIGEIDPELV